MTRPYILATVRSGIIRCAKAVRWWVTNLMGNRTYDVYVAHRRKPHPEAQLLGEREFWRAKYSAQDETPGARCCCLNGVWTIPPAARNHSKGSRAAAVISFS